MTQPPSLNPSPNHLRTTDIAARVMQMADGGFVCGIAKARAVLSQHALAHQLMRMRSLNIAFAG